MQKIIRRLRVFFRHIFTRRFFYGYFYNIFRAWIPVKKNHVLFESPHGNGFSGSPYALVKYMSQRDCFEGWLFVVVAPRNQRAQLRKVFPRARLRFVSRNSLSYAWYLSSCQWLINDVTFPLYFFRRESQFYLNLWHGTPLKKMGRDFAQEMAMHMTNTQRNFLQATHILVPNPHTAEIFESAYMLDGLWSGVYIQSGYPRNDIFTPAVGCSRGKRLDIAFMPTWRGTMGARDGASSIFLEELHLLLAELDSNLQEHETLWVKLHALVFGRIEFSRYKRVRPFPDLIEPYEHLSRCDVLVTDYSSVLFDFALTLRPIILHVPDKSNYLAERGFYLDPDDLPLTQTSSPEELIAAINALRAGSFKPSAEYQEFQRTFAPWDSLDNCGRVCATFFGLPRGVEPADINEKTLDQSSCPVLLYAGAMIPNGITRSFVALVSELGQIGDRFVVLADIGVKSDEAISFLKDLPPNVSFIPLQLHLYISPVELIRLAILNLHKGSIKDPPDYVSRIWVRECRRLFGSARFNSFVNFNGYSWRAALVSLGFDWKRIIYVHSDMAKEIDAGRVLEPKILEWSYRFSDAVALVRRGVEKEYCRRFYDYSSKVFYVPNCLREDVKKLAEEPLASAFSADNLPETEIHVAELLAKPVLHRFINLARFSDEKGQLRLIDAFEELHRVYPNTQLFIVGGYGPRLDDLRRRVVRSSASESIAVVVGSSNPFPLAKHCNTMVFSSFYEGIGLVLFESFELGLAVVSTDIPGPSEFLAQGYGSVVENSTQGLFHGMELAVSGGVKRKSFDVSQHNAEAVAAFSAMLFSVAQRNIA